MDQNCKDAILKRLGRRILIVDENRDAANSLAAFFRVWPRAVVEGPTQVSSTISPIRRSGMFYKPVRSHQRGTSKEAAGLVSPSDLGRRMPPAHPDSGGDKMIQPHPQAAVLLVDDSPADLLAFEVVLEDLGQKLVKAKSGEEALGLLEKDDFAVVLLDVQMHGLDGMETARRIRQQERSQHTPIIFLTGYDDGGLTVERAYALGAVDYLVKPLSPTLFRAKVAVFIDLFQKTEQLRLHERDRFRAIIEKSYDALALIDAEGVVHYASPSTVRILGYTPEEFVGRAVFELAHPDDTPRLQELFGNLLEHPGSSVTSQYRYQHKDGSWVWLEGTGTNLLNEPSVQAIVANYRDITEQKRAAEAKVNFLGVLAHELRNPLSPVLNGLQLLRLSGPSKAAEPTISMMERQMAHIAKLVDNLLEVSRVERGKIRLQCERLDLGRLVRTVVEDHRHQAEQGKMSLTVEIPETPVWVMGDATRLSQVLYNLLDNAIKFTDPGGSISVELQAASEGRQVALQVRDSGIGIEREMVKQLFVPFNQADRSLNRAKGGLGLGLALIKGLTELHGGEVEARSEGLGLGTEFLVRLPLEPEPAALTCPPSGAAATTKPKRVLVIEDNRDAADTLQMLLQLLGHEVHVAYTGPDGVQAAIERHPDIIISDIGLPGLDGYGVAREVRHNPATAGAKLIAVTGYGDEEARRRAQESGFNYVVTKPAEPAVLMQLLANGV